LYQINHKPFGENLFLFYKSEFIHLKLLNVKSICSYATSI
jgi:hypothetical protein